MNPNHVPRPTEYRKVLFRSKCEAVFARLLDLNGFGWIYEPDFIKVGRWVPDFWISIQLAKPYWLSMVLEYKPQEVTQTYRDELTSRFDKLRPKMAGTVFGLLIGNAYDLSIPRTAEYHFNGEWRTAGVLGGVWNKFDEAKSFRFDLKNQPRQEEGCLP